MTSFNFYIKIVFVESKFIPSNLYTFWKFVYWFVLQCLSKIQKPIKKLHLKLNSIEMYLRRILFRIELYLYLHLSPIQTDFRHANVTYAYSHSKNAT